MKISETTSYAHPILAPWSEDFTDAKISSSLSFREDTESNQLSVQCSVTIDQPDIVALIDSGSAVFGCYIKCNETGFRRLQPFGFPLGRHDFAQGAFLGRVQLRPMVWTTKRIAAYLPSGVHAEYSCESELRAGTIIAIDEEMVLYVTRPDLPAFESIFDIDSSPDIRPGEFEVDTADNRITVRTDEKTFALVQGLRQTDQASRAAVMNGLYIPVVMEILNQLRGGVDQFEQYRWVVPFLDRCHQFGVDVEAPDLLNDAQKILGQPFADLAIMTGAE